MRLAILILCFILTSFTGIEQSILGEYVGKMPYTIWADLNLKQNGNYEYRVWTHQNVYTKDKGKWKSDNGQLVLNSSKKIRKKIDGKKVGEANFLFDNFKFTIEQELLKYDRANKVSFKEVYFDLIEK